MATNIPFPVTPLPAKPLSTTGLDTVLGVKDGAIVQQADRTFTPWRFLAKGDGVTDDTAALNAMFDAVRALIISSRYIRVKIDLNGGIYRVNSPINATGIQCWNMEICNGVFLGHTTGKSVIDNTGTRGVIWRNILIYGDKTDMPTVPFTNARATVNFHFCDNNLFDNVTSLGYFSVAAHYCCNQETTTHLHCRAWNFNPDAQVAIFEGTYSGQVTSDFKTIPTGGDSFTNCKYINCDYRYLPQAGETLATVTGLSKANPMVVTCSGGHPFVNGDEVIIGGIPTGLREANARQGVVANATSTTFELTGVDSSAYGSTFSGTCQAVKAMTKPHITLTSRMKQHSFEGCYLVTYGDYGIEMIWQDTSFFEEILLDFMMDGANSRAHYHIKTDGDTLPIADVTIRQHATQTQGAFIEVDTTPGSQLNWYGGQIHITSNYFKTELDLFNSLGDVALYDMSVRIPARAILNDAKVATLAAREGLSVSAIDDGLMNFYGAYLKDIPALSLKDGVTAPSAVVGQAQIYVDTTDGDLKAVFGDGVIKRIATDVSNYTVINTDVDVAVPINGSNGIVKHTGTLTAARALALDTTNASPGDRVRITRTGTGAFNLRVGPGPLKDLVTGTWCDIVWDGAALYLGGYGAL